MKQAKSILIISHHKVLQDTRTHILRHAGHQVYPARDYREAMLQLQDPAPLDLVLICHSVPPADLHHLVDRIRVLRPALPILLFL
ncbi:MAG: response regulator [Acidobacteriia bacterium]|nr:response regulator [Terriglobia bacterium]